MMGERCATQGARARWLTARHTRSSTRSVAEVMAGASTPQDTYAIVGDFVRVIGNVANQ
jgi:hypothetical protein